jgi:hypothetical protein
MDPYFQADVAIGTLIWASRSADVVEVDPAATVKATGLSNKVAALAVTETELLDEDAEVPTAF